MPFDSMQILRQKLEQQKLLELTSPHWGQQEIHDCPARFRTVAAGRRWGKTYTGVREIAKHAWTSPKNLTMWAAPTYRQAKKGFTLLHDQYRPAIRKSVSSAEMAIDWVNGARSVFVSTENYDHIRGEGVGFMVVDESAFVPEDAWTKVLRPMLSDTAGHALHIGTPHGKNWFFNMWLRGQDPEFPDYASFNFKTIDSPYIPDEEVDEARDTLPADVFSQEYEAAFLDEAAGVFTGIRKCVAGELGAPMYGHQYMLGADIAKHTDFTVLTVMDITTAHVVAWERFNNLDYKIQCDRIENLAREYDAMTIMDSSGVGDPVMDELVGRGLSVEGYKFTNTSKQQLIENLVVAISKHELTYPDLPVLIGELEGYRYEMMQSGRIRYSAPDGYHDDCVISLALAAWLMRHPIQYDRIMVFDDAYQISPF